MTFEDRDSPLKLLDPQIVEHDYKEKSFFLKRWQNTVISQPKSYLKYKERGKGKQVFPDSSPNRALKVKVSSKESLIKISFRLVVSSVIARAGQL